MGDVVKLRDYQRKEQPIDCGKLDYPTPTLTCERVIYCSSPIKDTAPSEFCAPLDDPA
jgi:hypothetical protein